MPTEQPVAPRLLILEAPMETQPNLSRDEPVHHSQLYLENDAKYRWPDFWFEDFLQVVHYNFKKGLAIYCVTCRKGLYQEKDFVEGALHYGHSRLKMSEYQGAVCTKKADFMLHAINTRDVQSFWNKTSREAYLFLNNTFGYANRSLPQTTSPRVSCAYCRTKLQYKSNFYQTKFCSLECKFRSNVDFQPDSLLRKSSNTPVRTTPPPLLLPKRDMTYAQVTLRRGIDSGRLPGRFQMEGRVPGCNGHSLEYPQEISVFSDTLCADFHDLSVQQPSDLHEGDSLTLPQALYDVEEVRSCSICEEYLSRSVLAEQQSFASSFGSTQAVRPTSFTESKPLKTQPSRETLPIRYPPGSMVPTKTLFRTALAATSSSSLSDEWRLQKTRTFTKANKDHGGEGMGRVEGHGPASKSLDNNVLRKAAQLLRIFVSENEGNQSVSDEDCGYIKEGLETPRGADLRTSLASVVQFE
jgi:hypothetical protein